MPHLPHLKSFLLASALTALTLSPAWAKEKFKVVTTFTVIADMASNVAGDAADVSSITKPGAEIHEYQPTPGDIKRAQGAQLILSNGLNLELWFARFYQNLSGVPEVMVSNGVQPMGISEGPYNGKPNPHAWMSAENALIYVDNIRDALMKYDPDNAATYQKNAQNYKAKIQQTLAPLHTELAKLPADKRWLVTSEGAFSYLARDNSLKELYLWPINADQQGTPKQVRKVIDAIRGIISQRYLAKAPCPTNQRVRLPVSLARITAACCMSIRSALPMVRYRPIWIYCASPRKPLLTASTRVWRANHESLCDYRKSGYGDVSQRSYRIAGRHFSGSGRLNCRSGRRQRVGKINAFKALMGFVRLAQGKSQFCNSR
jgi:manganese/iron transport system substrate-binding protein